MLKIVQTTEDKVTKIKCPRCGERVGYVGLLPNSSVRGLAFKCRRCGDYWEVFSKRDKKQANCGGERKRSLPRLTERREDANEKM